MSSAADGRDDHRTRVRDLAILATVVLLSRLPDLFLHYRDWDEAAMMSQAWAMTQGQVLYKDIFQIHPVLHFALFYPFFAWLPATAAPHAIKALNAALVLAGAWLTRGLARRETRDADCALAAGVLFAGFLGLDAFSSSYGEFYALLPLLLSLREMSAERPRWAAVGALWGAAFFFKQTAALDAAALAGAGLLLRRVSARALARAAAGAVAVAAAVAVCFAAHGALSQAFDAMVVRPLFSYRAGGLAAAENGAPFAAWLARSAARTFFPFGLTALAALAAARRRPAADFPASARDGARTAGAWLAAAALGVLLIRRENEHYLIALLPASCLLTALALRRASPRWRAGSARVLAAAALLWAAPTCAARLWELAKTGWTPPAVAASNAFAALVRANSREDETLFLYGLSNLDVFYLAGRLSNNGVYMFVDMEATHMGDPELAAELRRRFLAHPPSLLAINSADWFRAREADRSGPFFADVLKGYRRVGAFAGADVYRLAP